MNVSPLVVEILKQFALVAVPIVARGLAEGFLEMANSIVEDEALDNRQTVEALQELLKVRNLTINIALEE